MNKLVVVFLLFGICMLAGCSKEDAVMTAQMETNEIDTLENPTEVPLTEEQTFIYVYVCGNVKDPGVYPLKPGARIYDALKLAGGVTEEGKAEALDQAQYVEDGQTIYVPGIYEVTDDTDVDDGLVDINKADKELLMTLPGIGESKAEQIIQFREEHGTFESIEDLMNIPGIKEGVYNKIKALIKVS